MNNLNEARQFKLRGVSCREVIQETESNLDEIDSIIVVSKDKEGYISVGYSTDSGLDLIGLLEVAKQEVFDGMIF